MPRQLPLAAILPTLGVVLTLAGCGGTAPRPADSTPSAEPTQKSAPRSSARKSTVVQKRGGAYYKDDGPGDDIPDNLDDLPDADAADRRRAAVAAGGLIGAPPLSTSVLYVRPPARRRQGPQRFCAQAARSIGVCRTPSFLTIL